MLPVDQFVFLRNQARKGQLCSTRVSLHRLSESWSSETDLTAVQIVIQRIGPCLLEKRPALAARSMALSRCGLLLKNLGLLSFLFISRIAIENLLDHFSVAGFDRLLDYISLDWLLRLDVGTHVNCLL